MSTERLECGFVWRYLRSTEGLRSAASLEDALRARAAAGRTCCAEDHQWTGRSSRDQPNTTRSRPPDRSSTANDVLVASPPSSLRRDARLDSRSSSTAQRRRSEDGLVEGTTQHRAEQGSPRAGPAPREMVITQPLLPETLRSSQEPCERPGCSSPGGLQRPASDRRGLPQWGRGVALPNGGRRIHMSPSRTSRKTDGHERAPPTPRLRTPAVRPGRGSSSSSTSEELPRKQYFASAELADTAPNCIPPENTESCTSTDVVPSRDGTTWGGRQKTAPAMSSSSARPLEVKAISDQRAAGGGVLSKTTLRGQAEGSRGAGDFCARRTSVRAAHQLALSEDQRVCEALSEDQDSHRKLSNRKDREDNCSCFGENGSLRRGGKS